MVRYVANSDLIAGYTAQHGSSSFHVTKSFEAHRDLITQVQNTFGSTVISRFGYVSDAAGRRTSIANTGLAFADVGDAVNLYGYNSRSELTSAYRAWGSDPENPGDAVSGRSHRYSYDNIGNRLTARNGRDIPAREETYLANALNQYTQRTVPGHADITGSADPAATVTVNNEPVVRQGAYWHKDLEVDNLAAAAYPVVTTVGVKNNVGSNGEDVVTQDTGRVFVPKTPELFSYDEDGNMLSDGRCIYQWDAENRLIGVENRGGVASRDWIKAVYRYDFMGRRIGKKLYGWKGNGWASDPYKEVAFIYDGWNVICESTKELKVTGGGGGGQGGGKGKGKPPQEEQQTILATSTNFYCWSLDLSGSLQGAGGIGGLVSAVFGASGSTPVFYTFCANGNVSELIGSTNGTILAHYEYSPVGAVVTEVGSLAGENQWRFSTKYWDEENGLGYWGYRYYSTEIGRWLSRDPIGEKGGTDLYAFVLNDPVDYLDKLGLACSKCPKDKKTRASQTSKCGTEYRTEVQAKVPDPNGCTGVPDADLFWDFGPACDGHDICYATCGSDKSACDEAFLTNMKNVCAAFKWMPLTWLRCNTMALTYGVAVMRLGGRWHENAQDEYCKWQGCCN